MTTYYKATRPDGRDFHSRTIDYGAALLSGEVIRHPKKRRRAHDPATYLSVSVEPADCTNFEWPCRLFRVEPVGRAYANPTYPSKREVSALRVVEELPAWMALGPNGQAVVAFLDRLLTLTPEQSEDLAIPGWSASRYAAWYAAWSDVPSAARNAARSSAARSAAAWSATRDATWSAVTWSAATWSPTGSATWSATWSAIEGALLAILARDRISVEQYDLLTRPFRDAGLGEWVA